MRAPLARLKSSYCPCTVPSAYLSAVNENVRSSPAMVKCPAPVADCTTGPLSWPSIVSAPDDLAIVSVVEPPSQPASTTANRVVVQRGILRIMHLLEIGSCIPDTLARRAIRASAPQLRWHGGLLSRIPWRVRAG